MYEKKIMTDINILKKQIEDDKETIELLNTQIRHYIERNETYLFDFKKTLVSELKSINLRISKLEKEIYNLKKEEELKHGEFGIRY